MITKTIPQPKTEEKKISELQRLERILRRNPFRPRKAKKQVTVFHSGSFMKKMVPLFRRHGGKCFWCDAQMELSIKHCMSDGLRPTFDHVLPQVKGGDWDDNLVLSCADCNNKKSGYLVNPSTGLPISPSVIAFFLKE